MPSDYTFSTDNPDIVITLGHDTKAASDYKTVTRTINVKNPDGSVKTTTQKTTLVRQGNTDLATGNTNWPDWNKGNWNEFVVPEIAGYTPSVKRIHQVTVDKNTKDTTVNVSYTANDQRTAIIYQDANGNVVKKTNLTGKTGQTVDVHLQLPEGYDVVAGQDIPGTYTFDGTNNPAIVVKVSEQHATQPDQQPSNHDDHKAGTDDSSMNPGQQPSNPNDHQTGTDHDQQPSNPNDHKAETDGSSMNHGQQPSNPSDYQAGTDEPDQQPSAPNDHKAETDGSSMNPGQQPSNPSDHQAETDEPDQQPSAPDDYKTGMDNPSTNPNQLPSDHAGRTGKDDPSTTPAQQPSDHIDHQTATDEPDMQTGKTVSPNADPASDKATVSASQELLTTQKSS